MTQPTDFTNPTTVPSRASRLTPAKDIFAPDIDGVSSPAHNLEDIPSIPDNDLVQPKTPQQPKPPTARVISLRISELSANYINDCLKAQPNLIKSTLVRDAIANHYKDVIKKYKKQDNPAANKLFGNTKHFTVLRKTNGPSYTMSIYLSTDEDAIIKELTKDIVIAPSAFIAECLEQEAQSRQRTKNKTDIAPN